LPIINERSIIPKTITGNQIKRRKSDGSLRKGFHNQHFYWHKHYFDLLTDEQVQR
jgi:hypothetical protein